jgi:hypothetical protein
MITFYIILFIISLFVGQFIQYRRLESSMRELQEKNEVQSLIISSLREWIAIHHQESNKAKNNDTVVSNRE